MINIYTAGYNAWSFYELKTNRPLYITKGTRIYGPRSKGHISKKTSLPFDGYEVTYSDKSVINHYSLIVGAKSLESIDAEYRRVLTADRRLSDVRTS